MEEIQPLLDVAEAAAMLGVSPYTIRSWIRKGGLGATKLGRLVRIEPSEVQRLIAAGRSKVISVDGLDASPVEGESQEAVR